MKRLFAIRTMVGLLLALWLTLPLAAQDAEGLRPGPAMNILDLTLGIFSEANHSSGRLGEIEPGELVNVLQIDAGWAQIEDDEVVGWTTYATPSFRFLINVSGPTPMPRGYHHMAYDVESDRVILWSGLLSGSTAFLNDTWSYAVDTNTWKKMAPVPSPPAGEGPIAYDMQSDRVILFYGSNDSFSNTASETWAYDFNTDTWTQMMSASAPPPLLGARMVYDSESDRMVLFGGIDLAASTLTSPVFSNDTWAYDYDTDTWEKMEPATNPPGVNYHAMAYDAAADRVIMILMGFTYPGADLTDDTWAYDLNTDTWEVRKTDGTPGRRDYSAMVYAAGRRQIILFGAGEPRTTSDTWAYDYTTNTWTELEPELAPSARGFHAMVYSSAADQVVLFGGGRDRDRYVLETWLFDPNTENWTNVGP